VRVSLGSPVTTLVSAGSVWKYNDSGLNLSNAWRGPAFDDSGWPAGPAQLGYGDYDEATVVSYGTNPASKHITTCFRHAFTVGDPTHFATLLLRVLRDDGAVLYLNGAQVWRNNLSAEPLTYLTLADQAVTGGDESTNFYSVTVSPALLVAGSNVLAVEVHQNSPESSDLSFDLELLAFPPGALPRLEVAPAGLAVAVQWPAWASGFVLRSSSGLPAAGPWASLTNSILTTNGRAQVVVPVEAGARFYELQRP
jgi:hypothetical protein